MLSQRVSYFAAVLWALIGGAADLGLADEIHLVQGGKIVGEIEQSGGEHYVVQTRFGGRVVLAASQVASVVPKSDMQRRYEAVLPSLPDTEQAHEEMAKKCQQAGLEEQRLYHLEQVLRHNSDHEEARRALGYGRIKGRWLRQDEWMKEQGYLRYEGSWRLPQEIEILKAGERRKDVTVHWRKQLKTWRTWIVKGHDNGHEGLAQIRAIRDPLAVTALADQLNGDKELRELKLLYVDVLSLIPSGEAVAVLAHHALNNDDGRVREACLDRLEQTKPPTATSIFVAGLNHDNNQMVNRAAIALGYMQDPSATVPLIDALITEHKYVVGGGPGMQTSFSGQGGGGLSMGGKAEVKKIKQQNEAVLHALNSIHNGVNFGYNQAAWKNWYITKHTPPPIDLRRGG